MESDPDFMNRSAQLGNRVLDLAAALMEQVCVVSQFHCALLVQAEVLRVSS